MVTTLQRHIIADDESDCHHHECHRHLKTHHESRRCFIVSIFTCTSRSSGRGQSVTVVSIDRWTLVGNCVWVLAADLAHRETVFSYIRMVSAGTPAWGPARVGTTALIFVFTTHWAVYAVPSVNTRTSTSVFVQLSTVVADRSAWAIPVSYTHLTLPTIYSV